MLHPYRRALARALALALVAGVGLATAVPSLAKGQKKITTLRVMLNPAAAPRGTLPDAARARIEALAGAPVSVAGVTRTGALELNVGGRGDVSTLQGIATRLRADRAVLWAEVAQERSVRPKHAVARKAAQAQGDRLMLRFQDDADGADVLSRLASIAGMPLAVDRTIGAVHVVRLAQPVTVERLEALASAFETDAGVRYADPVRRAEPYRVPNDPLFAQQWSLEHIGAAGAWDATTGSAGVTVAVVDTGMLDHPDLAGRVLPGYDFISDAGRARDGDGRDDDPTDEGDWSRAGECSYYDQPSFFHGLFVAGQIAANGNNEIGIAGLDWSAKILPVRVLGKCGGTFDDILAGVMWAAGLPVDGAPANPNPAKVINLSLGGFGQCPGAVQEAIDEALAQGTVIVAAAGNESDDASFYAPANCSGVITVGALGRSGSRSSYSNFGPRLDLSAPGGDNEPDGLILSTHAAGSTTPGEFTYDVGMGTSFSAPLVSGTLSLMLARNPNLTGGQALSILRDSSIPYEFGSTCGFGTLCGVGMLNTAGALRSTLPASATPPEGAVAVVEFYDAELDHYLITADANEIATLEASGADRWKRTGHAFYAWADPSLAPAGIVPRPVCRFYAGPEHRIDAHFFTADADECNAIRTQAASVWTLQSPAAFWIETPDAGGNCRDGTLPVYRFFNGRRDANQRHTIDLSVRRGLVNRAWVPDGPGEGGAAMCSLI